MISSSYSYKPLTLASQVLSNAKLDQRETYAIMTNDDWGTIDDQIATDSTATNTIDAINIIDNNYGAESLTGLGNVCTTVTGFETTAPVEFSPYQEPIKTFT